MRKDSLEFLRQLLTTPSPSGYESAIQKIWCDYDRPFADEVRTDAYGNAVAVLNPDGDPKLMIDGHADELGLMIKHIDEKGYIYFQRIGGVDPALVRSKRVNIHAAKGVVRGVIGAPAIHLQERDRKRSRPSCTRASSTSAPPTPPRPASVWLWATPSPSPTISRCSTPTWPSRGRSTTARAPGR